MISGNTYAGVYIRDTGTSGNVVLGNYLGTDAGGTVAVPNGSGVAILGGASGNTIGGGEPNDYSGGTELSIDRANFNILGNARFVAG